MKSTLIPKWNWGQNENWAAVKINDYDLMEEKYTRLMKISPR